MNRNFRSYHIRHTLGFLFICAVSLLTACVSAPPKTPPPEKDLLPASQNLGNALLDSIRREDFKAFHACTPGSSLETMTEAEFMETCRNQQRQFGTIVHSKYLCSLETPCIQNSVWIVAFERKSAADPQKTIRQELLFRLLTAMDEGKLRIMALGFL